MQYSEMQVGDMVEITDKRTVTISRVDYGENAYDQDGKIIMADGIGSREFGLIERPTPPLPTKPGSFLKVTSDEFNEPGFWLLTGVEGSYTEWVSSSGVRKTPSEFRTFIGRRPSRRFEVIQ